MILCGLRGPLQYIWSWADNDFYSLNVLCVIQRGDPVASLTLQHDGPPAPSGPKPGGPPAPSGPSLMRQHRDELLL